jgi:diadenosine tetraphosphate (Ap4A) HIT family hydrolase
MQDDIKTTVKNLNTCPFCNHQESKAVIIKSEMAFSIYDRYPVNPGHALVIPKRHCADYFALSIDEQSACWEMVNQVKEVIDQTFNPDGYNIGINNLESAGQTLPHVHIHLIPRYKGDVLRPQGGIRGVIPGKKEY